MQSDKGLIDCVNVLTDNLEEEVIPAIDVLIKCTSNILNHPTNSKYRRLKVASRDVTERLIPVKGALECLFIVGFEEGTEYIIFPENADLEPMQHLHDLLMKRRLELKEKLSAGTAHSGHSVPAASLSPTDAHVDVKPSATQIAAPWDTKIYPSDIQVLESKFQEAINSSLSLFQFYEDPSIQHKARSCIPINELNHNAQRLHEGIRSGRISPEIKPKPMNFQDCLLLELLFWFKNSFFKWFDTPDCHLCDKAMVHSGFVPPLPEEEMWGAGRVENYKCQTCNTEVRFPRYNHPLKLLGTRTGRCGEWANCFTLCCCALRFEARYIRDWTDHVWTEVYSTSQKRWLHCDPCENVCDAPLLYEAGWGKKLSYILAFGKDAIQDVTWRYSSNHADLLSQRLLCRETWLVDVILRTCQRLQQGLDVARKTELNERLVCELVEFLSPRVAGENEKGGRTSGALAWRLERGEAGKPGSHFQPVSFELSTEEILNKVFHLKYCTATDKYLRRSMNSTELSGWQAGVWEVVNVFRKVERDWKMTYLARTEGSATGSVSWKFDFSKTNLKVASLALKCAYTTYENGSVVWQLCSGDKCVRIPGGADVYNTSELRGAQQVVLSARLSGGVGDVAWQHAQLFRQSLKDKNLFLFDVTIHFE